MKTVASGWCPRHDRVYQRTDLCPECGTALVPVSPPKGGGEMAEGRSDFDADLQPLPPPRRRRPWTARLGLAGALLGAFALGVAFPRNDPEPASAGRLATARDLRPERTASTTSGGTLRLDSLTQSEDRLTARIRAIAGFPDPRSIQGAAVEVTVRSGDSESTVGMSDVHVVSDAQGFTIAGPLDVSGIVVGLRVTSIQVRVAQVPEWTVDVSSIWPVGSDAEPAVLRVEQPGKALADGTIRLRAMLAWRDRLEAVFALVGTEGEAGNRAAVGDFEMLTTPRGAGIGTVGGRAISAVTERISAGQVIARFEGVSEDAGRVVIHATKVLDFVAGPWTWRFA